MIETIPAPVREITFDQLHEATLGMDVTWPELLSLVERADRIVLNFALTRNGEPSKAGIEITREQARQRCLDGIRYAAERLEAVRIRANGVRSGTLWIA